MLLLACPVYAGFKPACRVSRVRHRAHAPDPTRCVRSLTRRGLQINFSSDELWVRHRTISWCARCRVGLQVQLVVNVASNPLRSASGATSSTSGVLVLCGIRVAGPWTWWVVFILLHLVHGRSLAHLISWESPCGAREKQEPREDWELSDLLTESFSSEFQEFKSASPLSSALFWLSESSLLVTFGDRHHLDGLVVIGGTKTVRSSCGWLVSSLWAVLGDSPRRRVKESARREYLVLAQTKGEQGPCAGAPTRTSGEWRLSDTSAKHHCVLLALILYILALTLSTYIPRIVMLDRIGTRLQNFYPVAL